MKDVENNIQIAEREVGEGQHFKLKERIIKLMKETNRKIIIFCNNEEYNYFAELFDGKCKCYDFDHSFWSFDHQLTIVDTLSVPCDYITNIMRIVTDKGEIPVEIFLEEVLPAGVSEKEEFKAMITNAQKYKCRLSILWNNKG